MFWKVHGIHSNRIDRMKQSFRITHRRRLWPQCYSCFEDEICFSQYYKVTDKRGIQNDKIGEILDYIQLKWQVIYGGAGKLQLAKQYGSVLVTNICGFVHVVRADLGVLLVNSSKNERIVKYKSTKAGRDEWNGQIFYDKRFHRSI